ncbi:MAG: XRE family transcriptional regulator [Pseudomonadota bacterium]
MARRPDLTQDPHAVREDGEQRLQAAIGRAARARRRELGVTVAELAESSGLSLGMISKIENGATSASLTSLQALAEALGMPITEFFRRFEASRAAVHVRAGEGVDAERRGTRAGHQYKLLGAIGANASGLVVEPYLITLTAESDVFPTFQHAGLEFIYMLEGEVAYRHGDRVFDLRPGDSLYFDADSPHGPEKLTSLPAVYLSVISYRPSE